mmetsp:Transcript_32318/g.64424  ORF Transcript_32318/g.64424 Transcript_32318/m.64424 type:complete len:292 (+) Transcript_32318:53-928(+)
MHLARVITVALNVIVATAGSFHDDRWVAKIAPKVLMQIRGGADPLSVICALRGKSYDVSASTVADVWTAIEKQAGLATDKQSVMFKGEKLTDGKRLLADSGVSAGDTLNIVPLRKSGATSKESKSEESSFGNLSDDEDDEEGIESTESTDLEKTLFPAGADKLKMEELMAQMGGKEGMKGMMKQMGLDGPMTPDKISGIVDQIKGMLSNPAITQLFENPEVLESSRKQILANPMMMQAYDSMGMGALIRDPDAFRQQMEGMKKMLENPEMLTKAMEGLSDGTIDDFDQGDL